MSYDNKVYTQEQEQRTYENSAEARRVIAVDDAGNESSPVRLDMEGLGDITVGTSEVEITITGTPRSIRIRADKGNAGTIFIGKTGVLSDKSNDFVRLDHGDEAIIDYNDTTNAIFAISDTTGQAINVGALL